MTDLEVDDLPFLVPADDGDVAWTRTPRRCLHPRSARRALEDGGSACSRCGRDIPAATARRGKAARARGNAFEREVAAKLGGRRVGQFGDQVDVDVPGYLRVQCKNGGTYPERLDRWLRAIPVQADLLRAVVIGDAPGPGGRRRSLIVLDLDEFASWHGGKP